MAELNRSDRDAAMPGGPQRRRLAILFADLSDSTHLASAMEAEEFADLLGQLRQAYESVVPRHGGMIVQIVGDGLLACFGYPDAREDDGRRATEAALELRDVVRRIRLEVDLPIHEGLHLHSGIHAGLVLVDSGDTVSGRIRLLGDPANIASRLSAAAARDEILVSKATLGSERHFYETDAGRELLLKGVAEPVTAYRIVGHAPVDTRFEARRRRGLTPFVGRQAELQTLIEGLDAASAGEPRHLAVVAAPGLGKTRLIEEFLSHIASRDIHVLRGYCESYLSAEPIQPFLQVLRSICGLSFGMPGALAAEALRRALIAIDPALAAHQRALLRALSLGVQSAAYEPSEQHSSESFTLAMLRLFDALASVKPVVLFIDDWQWADDAARQVQGAISSLEGRPIFVLTATRSAAPGDVGMSDTQVLNLVPLSESESAQTIAHLLPSTTTFVIEEILGNGGGNPLYVEELCHSVANGHEYLRGRPAPGSDAWLDMLIEARVQRLQPAQIELVRIAAVIGNVIPARVLEIVTGYASDHPLVHSLSEQDMLYPGEQEGTLRFKHGIARDVIYQSVGLRQRRALHRRVVEALRQQFSPGQEEEHYEALAYHYGAGEQVMEASQFAELAGNKAAAASALDRAQAHYLAALAAINLAQISGDDYQRWMRITQRLALVSVFDPSRECLKVLLQAVELATARGDQPAIASAEFCVGYIYYALGQAGHAIAHLEAGLKCALRVGDTRLVGRIRATMGQACAAACDYDKALALLDEAVQAKRARPKSSRPGIAFAYTLACKASVLGDRGQFDEAYQCLDEALDAVRGTGNEVEGSVLCWRSAVAMWHGRWDEAVRCALEAQRVAERVRSLYLYARSLSGGAYANWTTQRSTSSLQLLVDATGWLEHRGEDLFISLSYGWLAESMADRNDWQAVRRYAARALLRARNHDRIGSAMACRALARASAAGQGRRSAEKYLALAMDNAVARVSPREIAITRLCEAEIKLACGERTQAIMLLGQATATFEALGMAWHLEAAGKVRSGL